MRTLTEADPQFADLVELLYGDTVDPDVVWADVFGKAAPGQSDVSSTGNRDKMARRIALAGTVAGGALGVKELGTKAKPLRNAIKAGRGWLKPASAVGTAGVALGADVLATRVLNEDRKRAEVGKRAGGLVEVRKLSIGQLSEGFKNGYRTLLNGPGDAAAAAKPAGSLKPTTSAGGGHKPPIRGLQRATGTAAPQAAAPSAAPTAAAASPTVPGQVTKPGMAQALGNVAGAMGPKGMAAAGGVGAAGAYGAGRHRKAQQGYMDPSYGPGFGKRDELLIEGTFSKLDHEQQLAFGWASVTNVNGTPVVDRQGDYIDLEDIEKAAYDYVLKSRIGGDMHRRTAAKATEFDTGRGLHLDSPADAPHHVSDLVESIVFTDEKIAKLGLPEDFPRGWWVGFKIHDPDVWDLVKKGERTGFSIHGKGKRVDKSLDELHGYV